MQQASRSQKNEFFNIGPAIYLDYPKHVVLDTINDLMEGNNDLLAQKGLNSPHRHLLHEFYHLFHFCGSTYGYILNFIEKKKLLKFYEIVHFIKNNLPNHKFETPLIKIFYNPLKYSIQDEELIELFGQYLDLHSIQISLSEVDNYLPPHIYTVYEKMIHNMPSFRELNNAQKPLRKEEEEFARYFNWHEALKPRDIYESYARLCDCLPFKGNDMHRFTKLIKEELNTEYYNSFALIINELRDLYSENLLFLIAFSIYDTSLMVYSGVNLSFDKMENRFLEYGVLFEILPTGEPASIVSRFYALINFFKEEYNLIMNYFNNNANSFVWLDFLDYISSNQKRPWVKYSERSKVILKDCFKDVVLENNAESNSLFYSYSSHFISVCKLRYDYYSAYFTGNSFRILSESGLPLFVVCQDGYIFKNFESMGILRRYNYRTEVIEGFIVPRFEGLSESDVSNKIFNDLCDILTSNLIHRDIVESTTLQKSKQFFTCLVGKNYPKTFETHFKDKPMHDFINNNLALM